MFVHKAERVAKKRVTSMKERKMVCKRANTSLEGTSLNETGFLQKEWVKTKKPKTKKIL